MAGEKPEKREEDGKSNSRTTEDDFSPHKKVAHGAVLILAGTAVGHVFGFLSRAVPARLLGPDGYGLLILGFTVVSSISIVAKLGLHQGIARNLPRYNDLKDKRGIVISSIVMSLPISLAIAFFLFVFADQIAHYIFNNEELTQVLRLFSLTIPFLSVQALGISVFRGYKRAKERVIAGNIINPLLRFLFVTGAIFLGYGVFGATAGWVLGTLATTLFIIYILYRETPILRKGPLNTHYKSLLIFSLPLLVSSASGQILSYTDNILLGYYLSSEDVGLYDAAYTLGKLVLIASGAFAFLFLPVFSERHLEGEYSEMKRLYQLVTKWMVGVTLPGYLLFLLFPQEILSLLFTESFSMGGVVLIIVASSFMADILAGLNGTSLISMGFSKVVMYGSILSASLNVLLNLLLIPRLGIEGAAIASGISFVLQNIIYSLKLFNESGIQPLSKSLLKLGISGAIAALLVYQIGQIIEISYSSILLVLFSFVIVYSGCFILLGGLDKEDYSLIIAVKEKFKL